MYEQEYRCLLAHIARAVGGTPMPCEAAEDKILYQLAKKHGVVNLLSYAFMGRSDLEPQLRSALDTVMYTTLRQQVEQDRESTRLSGIFREKGIRFLPMKGALLRKLYPSPDMRISCDVDFFYDKERRAEVDAVMESCGYQKKLSDVNHDEYMKEPFVSVEMHRNLLTDLPTVDRYYQDIWDRLLSEDGVEYRMSDEDFYIYQTVHTMKHFRSAGTGIRSVLDTYIYLRAKPELDM